jgi:hypothetical protein
MPDQNKYGIVPKGPYSNIKEGVETDFSKITVGGVKIKDVENYAASLPLN